MQRSPIICDIAICIVWSMQLISAVSSHLLVGLILLPFFRVSSVLMLNLISLTLLLLNGFVSSANYISSPLVLAFVFVHFFMRSFASLDNLVPTGSWCFASSFHCCCHYNWGGLIIWFFSYLLQPHQLEMSMLLILELNPSVFSITAKILECFLLINFSLFLLQLRVISQLTNQLLMDWSLLLYCYILFSCKIHISLFIYFYCFIRAFPGPFSWCFFLLRNVFMTFCSCSKIISSPVSFPCSKMVSHYFISNFHIKISYNYWKQFLLFTAFTAS